MPDKKQTAIGWPVKPCKTVFISSSPPGKNPTGGGRDKPGGYSFSPLTPREEFAGLRGSARSAPAKRSEKKTGWRGQKH